MKKYADIRPNIKSGDILAWSHIGIKSWYDFKIWCVRLFTQSEYVHTATAWVVADRVFVIEAVTPLVRIYPLSKLGNFYWIPMDSPWYPETETLALSKIGCEYSQLQALQAPFSEPKRDDLFECAELVATIARADGVELGTVYTPTAIVEEGLKRSSTITLVENIA